jgi:hypothetical protein
MYLLRGMRSFARQRAGRIGHGQSDFRQRSAAVVAEVRPELSQAEARALLAASYGLAKEVAQERQAGIPSIESVADLMVRFLLG